MPLVVDVVVVSYNSRGELRRCVEPLTEVGDIQVIVVDNASQDRSLDVLSDLDVTAVPLTYNAGFSHGCNIGASQGHAPFVLFLNPDASIEWGSLRVLVDELEANATIGAVAPKIVGDDGQLHHSLRRFPRLRSTYGQALFLHRIFPGSRWTDEMIRDDEWYDRAGPQEWVSGACILVRREAFEEIGGFDEGFFLYCEDTDLCLRLQQAGHEVRYQPESELIHVGGASVPRAALLHVAVESRVRYAKKHRRPPVALVEQVGIALGALTHMIVGRGGVAARRGHARSLRAAIAPPRAPASRTARSG